MSERPVDLKLIRATLWRRRDEVALEHSRLMRMPDGGILLDGRVIGVFDGRPGEVFYAVHCGADWVTRHATAVIVEGADARRVQLRRDEDGTWWRDDVRITGLDGASDVDLSVTPATNTLPIRRLALEIDASAPADAAWVRFPELTVERLAQRYTRLDDRRYRYESSGGAFVAELEVDDEGIVTRYGDLWERVVV